MTLGLRPGAFYRDAKLHCLNLLLTYAEGCRANCAYCGLSRASVDSDGANSFIRVEWPAYATDEIIRRTRANSGAFERVCISMITHARALGDTLTLTKRLSGELEQPLSVLVNPTMMGEGDFEALREAGAGMASVALDAATPELFAENRGAGVDGPHEVERYMQALEEAVIVFGSDNVGCHLIAGLGETEQDMAAAIQRVRNAGARTHLFSFYPESGSILAGEEPCPADHFRRVQLARFLIDYDLATCDQMDFDEHGRIVGFGIGGARLDRMVDTGIPFMTSGCPGKTHLCACNRPYGDGPPSDIRSYPFNLDDADVLLVRKQLATYPEVPSREALDIGA